MEGRGKAYYPSFSALNYLNANDVRGRGGVGWGGVGWVEDDGERNDTEGEMGKRARACLAGEDKTQQRGANLLLLKVSGSSLVILKAR